METFQYLFNKFWSDAQRVTILGYEEPKFKLYKNFDFISLGEQTGIQDWDEYGKLRRISIGGCSFEFSPTSSSSISSITFDSSFS